MQSIRILIHINLLRLKEIRIKVEHLLIARLQFCDLVYVFLQLDWGLLCPTDKLHCVSGDSVWGLDLYVQARGKAWNHLLALEYELCVRHVFVGLDCVYFGEFWVNVNCEAHVTAKFRKLERVLLKFDPAIGVEIDVICSDLLGLEVLIKHLSWVHFMGCFVHDITCQHVNCIAFSN